MPISLDALQVWEDWPDMPENALTTAPVNYDKIVERLKVLAINIGNHCWEIGSLLLEADSDYNMANLGISSYLLIGCHPPNFWKTLSDQVGLSVASLKQYAAVARAFPPEKRFKELTWTHHLVAHIYVDAEKYLRVCVERGMEEIGKPHTIVWLEQYIDEQENCVAMPREERRTVSIELPLDMMRKFSDLAKHYTHKPVKQIVADAVRPALEAYLAQKAREISLQFFEFHDGETWPFGAEAKKKLGTKRRTVPGISIRLIGQLGPTTVTQLSSHHRKHTNPAKGVTGGDDSKTPANVEMTRRARVLHGEKKTA